MKSLVIKRSVVLNDHKTSVSLEEPFWLELKSIAAERNVTLGDLVSKIDAERQQHNLSSALRLFVLAKYHPVTVDTRSPDQPDPEPRGSGRERPYGSVNTFSRTGVERNKTEK